MCCAINVVNRVNKEMHQILHNFVIYFSKTKISCKSVQKCEILILFTGGFRSWKFIWILYGDTTYQEISVLSTICVAREFRNIKTNSFRTRKKILIFCKIQIIRRKNPEFNKHWWLVWKIISCKFGEIQIKCRMFYPK